MKKVIALEDLDCANCAAKMERGILQIEGVRNCSVNFMMQRMTLELDDDKAEEIIGKIKATVKRIEPDCRLKV